MATEKQIAANQRNAKNSTGPRTASGKRRSRRNSLRHGLTAETVIEVHEDVAAYKMLQRAITADYRPRCNFEIELINRLVSLLWRLRRAVAIESGLPIIQSRSLEKRARPRSNDRLRVFYDYIPALTPRDHSLIGQRRDTIESNVSDEPRQDTRVATLANDDSAIARTFLDLLRTNG